MEIRKSSFLKKTPTIGSIVAFNPPRYKGIAVGFVIGFMPQSGLPKVVYSYSYTTLEEDCKNLFNLNSETGKTGFKGDVSMDDLDYIVPKTGFEVVGNIFTTK